MIELVGELEQAGDLLVSALDKYLSACFAIRDHSQKADSLIDVPRAVASRITSMLSLAASVETKMSEGNLAISQAIKRFPALLPINYISSETLAHILHLAAGTYELPWSCALRHRQGKLTTMPKYPDLLSHVCTRWRRIMLDDPAFWAHIDVVPIYTRTQDFLARTEAYVARVGKMPLDIHFHCSAYNVGPSDLQSVLEFITTYGPQTRSLYLDTPTGSGGWGDMILQWCYMDCTPGTFTDLIVQDMDSIVPFTNDGRTSPYALRGELTPDRMDKLLHSVTNLRLHGLYFPWAHQAYHGLVELSLTRYIGSDIRITEAELIDIFRSSPRLQTLKFNIPISDPVPEPSSMSAVHLEDLEVLNLTYLESRHLGNFLRLLTPGSKPLRFSFTHHDGNFLPPVKDEITSFFARSNVARVCVEEVPYSPYPTFCELLDLLPDLQVLALQGPRSSRSVRLTLEPDEPKSLPTYANLPHADTLCLTGCRVDLDWVEETIKRHEVGRVIFEGCTVGEEGRAQSDHELKARLSGVCPVVICVGKEESNPVRYWD